ncbi:kinase-like domain-containing protein [Rhizophagus irregularis DAOM 181602=DAOM 197198]|nr:kinase-like domain-containing protein [Rhizophagus irregularis DAOM 181602=DAOM 197198]
MNLKEKRNLWKYVDHNEYQKHVTISTIGSNIESAEERWICTEFLNEIKTHLQIYLWDIIQCYGITQDPNTKDYIMVLAYCENGNLRNYYMNNESNYFTKIEVLRRIASGLLDIHNSGKVHKDFHSVNSDATQTTLHSECFDCQLDESDFNEINQNEEINIE